MPRDALKTIGRAIAASASETTIDELKAKGKRKFRVVNGKKVVRIIEAIVDDVIEQEAGDIAKRDRDQLVKQTQRKFERVMRLQSEQDARLAQLQEQLQTADEERRSLRRDKDFLEEQLSAAQKSAPEGEAVRLLTRELGRVKAGLQELDHKTKTLDGASIQRIVDRLGDRETQLTEHFHDELDQMYSRLDRMKDESESLQNATVDAVFERLVQRITASDDELIARIDARVEDLGTRIEELTEQAGRRDARGSEEMTDHLREIDERIAAVEHASTRVKEEAVATLMERLADRDGDIGTELVARVISQIEELSAKVHGLEERIAASREKELGGLAETLGGRIDAIEKALTQETRALVGAMDEMTSATQGYESEVQELVTQGLAETRTKLLAELDERFQERDARLSNAYLENLAEVKDQVEDIRSAAVERDNFLQSLVSSQLEETRGLLLGELNDRFTDRDEALALAFRTNMDDVRSSVDDLASQTSTQLAAMQVSLSSGVDALREGGGGTKVDQSFFELLDERLVGPLKAELSVLHNEVESRHNDALGAVAAADERGNALAERLEQLSESVLSIATRVDENAETQSRAMADLDARMVERAANAAAGQTESFDAALEAALDKITRTMQSVTAKPIEISAEATDVLLNKIFDAGDAELTSNLGQLDVEESRSKAGISRNLGRLRDMRGSKATENGKK